MKVRFTDSIARLLPVLNREKDNFLVLDAVRRVRFFVVAPLEAGPAEKDDQE